MKKFILAGCLVLLSGCIGINQPPPRPPLTDTTPPVAPNPILVQSCESTRTAHNNWTIVAAVLGASAGSGGALDATTSNKGVQTGIGVASVITGVLAAGATTISSIEANQYATDNCAAVLTQALAAGVQ